jgi:hypothetical protein
MPNKAKFQNAKNEHKSLFHNNYQQQTTNNELIKTKPNKANLQLRSELDMAEKKELDWLAKITAGEMIFVQRKLR